MSETQAAASQTTEGQSLLGGGATAAPEASTQGTEGATAAPATEQQQQVAQVDPAANPLTAGDKPAATEEPKEAAPKAPEKYEFKVAEGQALDASVMETFEAVARKHDLPQDVAQDIVSEVTAKLAARQIDCINQVRTEWEAASKADKEFGGEKLSENLGMAKAFATKFASPELMKLLDDTGLGNNPEVIRLFVRAGKAISEDSFVQGGRGVSQKPPVATASDMFPSMANP